MSLRFDDKVALITGAGAGIGRLYALYLAKRGAKVVVNDFGSTGKGADKVYTADTVVAEIKANGGEAVGNYDSVVDGAKVVQTAIDAFGRLDIIVNNAGILRDVSFARQNDQAWDLVLKVHLYGSRNICKAAWPHMRKQKYGRIVNITSSNGLYGQRGQTNYSAAKAAMCGFSKSLAIEGASKNIKVNVIAPGAGTAMTRTILPAEIVDLWKPDYVAPMVAYLCHESVPCTGDIFEAGGGFFAQVKYMRAPGALLDLSKTIEMEDIQANWGKISDIEHNVDPLVEDRGESGIPKQLQQVMKLYNEIQAKL